MKKILQPDPRYFEAASGLLFGLWFTGQGNMFEEVCEKSHLHNPRRVAYFLSFLTLLFRTWNEQMCWIPFWTALYPLLVWLPGVSHWLNANIFICLDKTINLLKRTFLGLLSELQAQNGKGKKTREESRKGTKHVVCQERPYLLVVDEKWWGLLGSCK